MGNRLFHRHFDRVLARVSIGAALFLIVHLQAACGGEAILPGPDGDADSSTLLGFCDGTVPCPWSAGASMPVKVRGHAAVVFGGQVFVFGGITDEDVNDEEYGEPSPEAYSQTLTYDPTEDAWAVREPMPIGLYDLSAHVIGDAVYVVGGYGAGGFIPAVMEYHPSLDSWAEKTPMPTHRYTFTSEVVDGRVYVIGGHGTIDDGPSESGKDWSYKSHVEIYDPTTDQWMTGASAPEPTAEAASCVVGHMILVFGGEAPGSSSATWAYDTVSDTWTSGVAAPSARGGHVCVPVGNELYLLGGRHLGHELNTIEIFEPASSSWREATTSLPTGRFWFGAEVIGSEIFVFGGKKNTPNELLRSLEILDTEGRPAP